MMGQRPRLADATALIGGDLVLADLAASDFTGEWAWVKPVQKAGVRGLHLAGVNTLLTVNGCLSSGAPTLAGPGVLQVSGGDLAAAETNSVTVTSGRPSVPSGSLLSWTVYRSGIFYAKVKVPGVAAPVFGKGLYLPKSKEAWGFFPGKTVCGRLELAVPAAALRD